MTAIPPVEERQVRPCKICMFGPGDENEYCESCSIDKGRTNERNGDVYRYMGGVKLNEWPCDSNFTIDEIQALIDQHNAGELPGWLKVLINESIDQYKDLAILNLNEREETKSMYLRLVSELEWVLSLKQQPRQEGQ